MNLPPSDIIEPLTKTEPLNIEPLSTEVTVNTSFSVDAVTAPLTINADKSASCVRAERGISNKSLPLPLNDEPLFSLIPPLINNEPVN